MCECEKRIDALKAIMKDFVYQVHDSIVDTTEESDKWYDMFGVEMDEIYNKIEAI